MVHLPAAIFATTIVAALCGVGLLSAAPASADQVAYLVNVTVRPGYNFPNANAALAYGYSVGDKIAAGQSYSSITTDIKADFATGDEFQASYLIGQAANELCPEQIWQLRNSAAGYRPTAPQPGEGTP